MNILKKLSVFSIIGITMFLMAYVSWNTSRLIAYSEGDDWLQKTELRSMNNDRPLPQLNNLTLKEVFEETSIYAQGKNLISHYYDDFIYNGITFSYNNDGSFTMTGTCTASFTYRISLDFMMETDTVYTFDRYLISGSDIAGTNSGLEFNDGSVSLINQTASGVRTFDSASRISGFVRITILSGVVMNHTIKYQLAKGSSSSSFEIYKSTLNYSDTPFLNWYDLSSYGIEQSNDEMDSWYDLYLENLKNDRPINDLNGYTLNELFQDNNLLNLPPDSSDWVPASSGGNTAVLNFYSDSFDVSVPNYHVAKFRTNFNSQSSHYYYYNFDVKGDSNSNYLHYYDGANYTVWSYLDLGWQNLSVKYQNPSSIALYFQSVAYNGTTSIIELKNTYILDLTYLDLEYLTVQELDSWFDLYLENQQEQEEDLYINLQDYNYVQQGSSITNYFMFTLRGLLDPIGSAIDVFSTLFGFGGYNTSYFYQELQYIHTAWTDDVYYLDPPTSSYYRYIYYEDGYYYLTDEGTPDGSSIMPYAVGSSGSLKLNYNQLKELNDTYQWYEVWN